MCAHRKKTRDGAQLGVRGQPSLLNLNPEQEDDAGWYLGYGSKPPMNRQNVSMAQRNGSNVVTSPGGVNTLLATSALRYLTSKKCLQRRDVSKEWLQRCDVRYLTQRIF